MNISINKTFADAFIINLVFADAKVTIDVHKLLSGAFSGKPASMAEFANQYVTLTVAMELVSSQLREVSALRAESINTRVYSGPSEAEWRDIKFYESVLRSVHFAATPIWNTIMSQSR